MGNLLESIERWISGLFYKRLDALIIAAFSAMKRCVGVIP